uniref:Uncharacterized protein n=1 Tax=Morchella importuna TaxID=1174673 RepID=A0A650AF86_9PEZI|nr:hypothetical protein [Morchella importuna]QGN66695.1 hypothetical protein [Morchella importuna]
MHGLLPEPGSCWEYMWLRRAMQGVFHTCMQALKPGNNKRAAIPALQQGPFIFSLHADQGWWAAALVCRVDRAACPTSLMLILRIKVGTTSLGHAKIGAEAMQPNLRRLCFKEAVFYSPPPPPNFYFYPPPLASLTRSRPGGWRGGVSCYPPPADQHPAPTATHVGGGTELAHSAGH